MTPILALATFGLEVVECGGALAINADRGGRSEAAVLLARTESQPQIARASNVLGVRIRFLDGTYGEIEPSVDLKKRLVAVIREVRPEIVITQDPEHSFHDLDPDRRPAMILYLEALALAGRDWQVEACGGHAPHLVRTIYYLTPHRPNCVVDVAPVWDRKRRALAELSGQLAFSGQMYRRMFGEGLAALRADHAELDDVALGRAIHHDLDRAFHLYHGPVSHGRFVLAEPYRREGAFHLETLIV